MAAELKIGIGADNSGLKQGLQDAEAQISAFVSKVNKIAQIGDQLSSIGQKMSVGLTLPIVGLATASLNAFKELEGVRVAFKRLNDPTLLDELRKATKNTTSDLQLMQSAVSAEKFGLSTIALPKLLEYARRVAKDTGQSVDYLVDSIVTGIGRKSPLILDNLGISATSLKEALGGVSMEAASVGEVTEAVAKIAQKELQKMGADANTLAESWAQVRTSISNSLGRIGEIINKNFDISGVIEKITGFINKAVSAFENLSPAIQKSILVVTGLVAAAGPLLVVVGGFLSALPTMLMGLGALKIAFTALTGPIGLVTVAVVGVVAAFVANWSKIKPYIVNTINYFRELYNESIVVRGAVVGLATMFKNSFAVISNILKTAWEIFKTFAKGTADLFAGVGKVLKGALTGDFGEINTGLAQMGAAWTLGISSLGKDIGSGIKELYNDIKRNFSEGFNDIINGTKLKPITDIKLFDTGKIAEKTEDQVVSAVTEGVKKANDRLKTVQIELPDLVAIQGSMAGLDIKNPLDLIFSEEKIKEYEERMSEMQPRIIAPISEAQAGIMSSISQLSEIANFGNFVQQAIATSFNFVVDAITDSFSAMGEAMATGGNVLSAAGNAILGSIGAFLGELGKQMVQYGVAGLAMAVLSQQLLNPITAAPAAIAMIAAGAALSLASGLIKGTLKGGSRGGGGYAPSGGSSGGVSSYTSSFSSGGNSEVVFRISGRDLVGVLNKNLSRNERLNG